MLLYERHTPPSPARKSNGQSFMGSQVVPDADQKQDLGEWLRSRANRKSSRYAGHSIYFEKFPPRQIEVPPGFATDFIGNQWPVRFGLDESPGTYETAIPAVNEEYFEYLDIFEAVADARGSFTMHEWGAGFARWSGVGVRAARECGIEDIRIACVEADPFHLAHSIENMWSLGIRDERLGLYPFAVAGESRMDLFVIGQPEDRETSHQWFGQALNDMGEYAPNGRFYHGLPEVQNPLGFRAIEIAVEPGSLILQDYDFIDLIDMDIQGAEADAVEESLAGLSAKVRRLHIGTHNREVEARLRSCLEGSGWILLRDLPAHARTNTAFGEVECVDGIQAWFNPRFPPPDWRAVEGSKA